MDSDPTEQGSVNNGMSREGSFFSITSATSGTSTYFTAKEDFDDTHSLKKDKNKKSKSKRNEQEERRHNLESKDRKDSSDSGSTTTMDGAESLRSTSPLDLGDNIFLDNMSSMTSSTSSASINGIEVREDISRICNTIAETEDADKAKMSQIELAIRKGLLKQLSDLAVSEGGLLSNGLRTRAWPLLLNVSPNDIIQSECKKIPKYFPDVPDKIISLVHLDVARVLRRFPPGLTDPQQDHLQSYLTNLICSVLQEKRQAYYYQGFHDISLTFLLVSISQSLPYLAYLCLNKMIETNLAPHMEKTMNKTHDVIHVLFAIIEAENPTLYKKIVIECKCPVAFCLPWVLTWFAHTLPNDTDVFRLYDYILGIQEKVDPPYLIPIFVSACLVLRNSTRILRDQELTDIASMHHRLAKLPSELESQEPWLEESTVLINKYAGKEEKFIQRGIEIKALQDRLWNEDTNNNRRRSRPIPIPRDGLLLSVSKFLFVRHRWTTISIVVLGTAFLLQTKYGKSLYAVKTAIRGYTPEPFQNIISRIFPDDGSGDE